MNSVMATAINGYECVLNGEKSGVDYLVEIIKTHRITDEEIIYLTYMAADIVERRVPAELILAKYGSE